MVFLGLCTALLPRLGAGTANLFASATVRLRGTMKVMMCQGRLYVMLPASSCFVPWVDPCPWLWLTANFNTLKGISNTTARIRKFGSPAQLLYGAEMWMMLNLSVYDLDRAMVGALCDIAGVTPVAKEHLFSNSVAHIPDPFHDSGLRYCLIVFHIFVVFLLFWYDKNHNHDYFGQYQDKSYFT